MKLKLRTIEISSSKMKTIMISVLFVGILCLTPLYLEQPKQQPDERADEQQNVS